MAPPKKGRLPKPLPEGFILSDTEKKKWRLGRIIGKGGFGLIYLASKDIDRPVTEDADFVIKMEYLENGPLFSELKFYQRAAKPENIEKWKRSRGLDFLGIPTYWGTGLAEYNNLSYRFMALDRLGSDLQKISESGGGRLKKATVLQLGQRLVRVLEFIHENEYVHADIKAANLMLGYRDPEQVYLVDYGLSYRYCPAGVHKEYKENPKKGHNGTIEYTSLDAHRGLAHLSTICGHDHPGWRCPPQWSGPWMDNRQITVTRTSQPAPSRRGDLQILGFCLLHWLWGSLPWESVLKEPTEVQTAKERLMDNLPHSVQHLSANGASTDELAKFLLHVKTLTYQDKPDYQYLHDVLSSSVTGRLDFSLPTTGPQNKPRQTSSRNKEPQRIKTFSKFEAMEVDEKDEKMKTKPVPPCQIRGPPLRKPQREDDALPASSRSLRPRASGISYKDHTEEEEEEEEEAKPQPIPAQYLRGPPTGPRSKHV